MTIIMILGSSAIGSLSGRFGPRLFMTVGPLIMAVGAVLLLTVAADFDYWWQVLPAMIVSIWKRGGLIPAAWLALVRSIARSSSAGIPLRRAM